MRPLLLLILSLFFLCGCSTKRQPSSINGVYGRSEYFIRKKFRPGYYEDLVLDIKDDTVVIYGTVRTWGTPFKALWNKEHDTVYLPDMFKIYRKSRGSDILILNTLKNDKPLEFAKLTAYDSLIGSKGLTERSLGNYLRRSLIAGTYDNKGQKVELTDDGKALNFPPFSHYEVYARTGTLWRYDSHNIINGDNAAYRYEIKGDSLILTKYTNATDEWEHYILSNEQYVLKRVRDK